MFAFAREMYRSVIRYLVWINKYADWEGDMRRSDFSMFRYISRTCFIFLNYVDITRDSIKKIELEAAKGIISSLIVFLKRRCELFNTLEIFPESIQNLITYQ